MAWTFDVGINTPDILTGTTNCLGLYRLKELLKGQGWTVLGSGDGLSAYSTTTDVITSAGGGAGGMKNTNAWFRIQQPVMNSVTREFIFQVPTTSSLTIRYSRSAGFSNYGSASSTVAPTATDSFTFVSAQTPFFNGGVMKLHVAAGGAAEGYAWYLWMYRTSDVVQQSLLAWDYIDPASAPAQEIDPYVLGVISQANPALAASMTYSSLSQTLMRANTTAVQVAVGAADVSRTSNSGAFNTLTYGGTAVNPYTLKDEEWPVAWGLPTTVSSPAQGLKGFSKNLRYQGGNRVTSSTFTVSTTRDKFAMGAFVFPWDGTVPT